MINSIDIAYLITFMFLASATNSLAGFGLALVAASALLEVFGLQVTIPLISACILVISGILAVKQRQHTHWHKLLPIVMVSLCMIPVGVWMLTAVPDDFMRTLLGIVIVGYVVYKLSGAAVPRLENIGWSYLAGAMGGLLGGAFNTAGPPVVIYTDTQDWPPDMFRANLQTYLFTNNLLAVCLHFWHGRYTAEVGQLFLWSLPALFVGAIVGEWLCRRISPTLFRKIVLFVLFAAGTRLCLTYWL